MKVQTLENFEVFSKVETVLTEFLIAKNKISPAHSKVGIGNLVSDKTLCYPFLTELWRHYVLSGGTQRCTLPWYQSEEMKILHIYFPWVGSNLQPATFKDLWLASNFDYNVYMIVQWQGSYCRYVQLIQTSSEFVSIEYICLSI